MCFFAEISGLTIAARGTFFTFSMSELEPSHEVNLYISIPHTDYAAPRVRLVLNVLSHLGLGAGQALLETLLCCLSSRGLRWINMIKHSTNHE